MSGDSFLLFISCLIFSGFCAWLNMKTKSSGGLLKIITFLFVIIGICGAGFILFINFKTAFGW